MSGWVGLAKMFPLPLAGSGKFETHELMLKITPNIAMDAKDRLTIRFIFSAIAQNILASTRARAAHLPLKLSHLIGCAAS